MLQDPNRGELEDHNKATVSESAVSNRPGVAARNGMPGGHVR